MITARDGLYGVDHIPRPRGCVPQDHRVGISQPLTKVCALTMAPLVRKISGRTAETVLVVETVVAGQVQVPGYYTF